MKKNFRQILREFNELKSQLSQDYFADEEPMDDEMMERGYDERDMPEGDSEEEKAMHAQDVIQHEPIIGKIRETAIEGLKKYSDHPTSSLYAFFKKVFLESDKVLTDDGSKK